MDKLIGSPKRGRSWSGIVSGVLGADRGGRVEEREDVSLVLCEARVQAPSVPGGIERVLERALEEGVVICGEVTQRISGLLEGFELFA